MRPTAFLAATLVLPGALAAAEDHLIGIEERAQQIVAVVKASQAQKPGGQNIGYPWLALWHLRRGETEAGLAVLRGLLPAISPKNQGHPFLTFGLAHLWLHYGKLYDAALAARWRELTVTRSSFSYNLDPFPDNAPTSNLRMTGSTGWFLSTLGFGLAALPATYPPTDDPDRARFLHRALTKIGRTGMPEYASRPYGLVNTLPLLCLAEQTADPLMARKAAVVYEAYLATAAATWLQGHWPVASQRSYNDNLTQHATSGINALWLYFGGLPGDAHANGMAAAAMAYRPPREICAIANRRDKPHTSRMRASWVKGDDPDVLVDPTGLMQYSWFDRTYGVYSLLTAPGARLQENQVYGNGVMWLDPSGATSCLWVTVPTMDTNHTHGQPTTGVEYVQHEGALLLVAKPQSGWAFPWVKGNVPANHQAIIDDSAKDGRLYLAYPGALIAITAPNSFTWDPEVVIQLDRIPGERRRKAGDPPTDGFYRLKEGPLVVALDTLAPDRAQGTTPAERLAWFRGQVRERTRLTAADGTGTYRALNGRELQRTVGELPRVDGVVIDIPRRPFMDNPWMAQPYQQDPQAPCELTVSIDGKTRIYDLKDYVIRTHDGPARPTCLITAPSAGAVALRWTAGPGEPTGYVVRRATADGALTEVGTTTDTSWRDTAVRDGTTYRYAVAARNAGGTSPDSVTVATTPGPGIPANPQGLVATSGDGCVTLAWQASDGAKNYRLGRSLVPGGPYETIGTVTGTKAEDPNAANGTTRWYAVTAIGSGGESGFSDESQALPAPTSPTQAPTGITCERAERTIAGVVQSGYRVRYQPVPGALRHNLRLAAEEKGSYSIAAIDRSGGDGFITDAQVRKRSWLSVAAVNAGGSGPASPPMPLPLPPPGSSP